MTTPTPDPTLSPSLRSWVESANDPATDFPIQNLPFCAFEHPDEEFGCLGVRIGDSVLDLGLLHEAGLIEHDHDSEEGAELCHALEAPSVNELAFIGRDAVRLLRAQAQNFLLDGASHTGGQKARRVRDKALLKAAETRFLPPAMVMNYTDFYASIHHATTVGSMFRPDNALLPNYKYVPIGYHGRASSIVVSGEPIKRPRGQMKKDDAPGEPFSPPAFGPCRMLDYELEVGAILGPGNRLGEPITIDRAEDNILGLCLVNDWSARDIQKWEYQPLGPFLAKNFATTISPYVVTLDALAPFRCPAYQRPDGDPAPLDYLRSDTNQKHGGFDITLEVTLATAQMRAKKIPPFTLSRSNAFRDMYWTFAQLLTHHTSNGCNVLPGDLIASGTISGPEPSTRGCLLERTWAGRDASGKPLPRTPVELPTGEKRLFLEDGDEVIIRGWCEREGYRRIGFGECRGTIVT